MFLLLLSVVWGGKMYGQSGVVPVSATGGCSSVSVFVTPPTVFSFEADLWRQTAGALIDDTECSATLLTFNLLIARCTLQLLNANGTWSNVATASHFPHTFTNITQSGTYRVLVTGPSRFRNQQCPSGYDAFALNGQRLGRIGVDGGLSGTTNSVLVGTPTSADIDYALVEYLGEPNPNYAFDFGEPVIMDARNSKNYDTYWLAIYELVSPYRSLSAGNGSWLMGHLNMGAGTQILDAVWDVPYGWVFGDDVPHPDGFLYTYRVQFATANTACPNGSWNAVEKTFQICPGSLGCRFVTEDGTTEEVSLRPNPASAGVQLSGIDLSQVQAYRAAVYDLTGRLVRDVRLEDDLLDVSDIPSGMYTLILWKYSVRIFADKLAINR